MWLVNGFFGWTILLVSAGIDSDFHFGKNGHVINFEGECVTVHNFYHLQWNDCQLYDKTVMAPKWKFFRHENATYGKIGAELCHSTGVKSNLCWTMQGVGDVPILLEDCRPMFHKQDFVFDESAIWSANDPDYCVIYESETALRTEKCHNTDVGFFVTEYTPATRKKESSIDEEVTTARISIPAATTKQAIPGRIGNTVADREVTTAIWISTTMATTKQTIPSRAENTSTGTRGPSTDVEATTSTTKQAIRGRVDNSATIKRDPSIEIEVTTATDKAISVTRTKQAIPGRDENTTTRTGEPTTDGEVTTITGMTIPVTTTEHLLPGRAVNNYEQSTDPYDPFFEDDDGNLDFGALSTIDSLFGNNHGQNAIPQEIQPSFQIAVDSIDGTDTTSKAAVTTNSETTGAAPTETANMNMITIAVDLSSDKSLQLVVDLELSTKVLQIYPGYNETTYTTLDTTVTTVLNSSIHDQLGSNVESVVVSSGSHELSSLKLSSSYSVVITSSPVRRKKRSTTDSKIMVNHLASALTSAINADAKPKGLDFTADDVKISVTVDDTSQIITTGNTSTTTEGQPTISDHGGSEINNASDEGAPEVRNAEFVPDANGTVVRTANSPGSSGGSKPSRSISISVLWICVSIYEFFV